MTDIEMNTCVSVDTDTGTIHSNFVDALGTSESLGSTVAFWENREKQYREAISLLRGERGC